MLLVFLAALVAAFIPAGADAPSASPAASASPVPNAAPVPSAAPVSSEAPGAAASAADGPTGPSLQDALDAIAAYAPQALKDQGTPGLSVAITDRTHVLALVTLGYANVDAKTPVTAATRFPIGSITKSMTALSLMQVYDAGALDLNAPVERYLPDFHIESKAKPLVHQLLSHTAGFPDDYSVTAGYGDAVYDLRDASVLFAPGTAFAYSNDGFATAGAILERVDRRPWNVAVRARVFDPLGMTHTSAVFTPAEMADTAIGYTVRDPDRPQPAVAPPLVATAPFDFVDPAGSVISNPADMAAYLRFYLNGGTDLSGKRLITEAAFAKMTTPDDMGGKPAGAARAVLDEAPEFYRQYGFGLSVIDDGGDHVVAHTGGISGYTACFEANLTRGFGVVALSNLVEAPLHPCAIVRYAMQVLRAQSAGQALPPAPAAPDPAAIANAADYGGTFRAFDGTLVTIARSGPGAQIVDGTATYHLYPRGEDTFWTDDPRFAQFVLAFYRDKAHVVTDFTAGPQQFVNPAYRGPTSYTYPPEYDALTGRYETIEWGQISTTRVIKVKGRLTFDGTTPLVDKHDGTFRVGSDVVRFDHVFGGRPQRMWIDDIDMGRIELP